jgi:hypothetical protein
MIFVFSAEPGAGRGAQPWRGNVQGAAAEDNELGLFGKLGVKICDPHGVMIVSAASDAEWFASLKKLLLARPTFRKVGCFDADMSQEGRLIIYFDHNWKCTW